MVIVWLGFSGNRIMHITGINLVPYTVPVKFKNRFVILNLAKLLSFVEIAFRVEEVLVFELHDVYRKTYDRRIYITWRIC